MRRVLAAASLTLAAAACGSSQQPVSTDPSASARPLAWGACTDIVRPDGEAPAAKGAEECAKLAVPLDYANPGGDQIDLALIRIPVTDKSKRLGSLVFNFGGPGGSGVDTLAQAAKAFGVLNSRYDLVSFDPRGVERSSGVRCGDGAQMDAYSALDTQPDDAETQARTDAANKKFAGLCEKDSGKVLPYVGTVNAAQDMDRIRAAVGDDRLNYFGMSYGTQLGAVYATKFPAKVGRMVLDAPLDPTVTFEQRTIAQTAGFQQAYESFLKACVKEKCSIGDDVESANRNVDRLLSQLTTDPIKVGDRELTQGLASTGVAAALYSELSWPLLETGLDDALKGNGEVLMYLADSYAGRNADGSYNTQMSSFPAITCVDNAERPGTAELERTEEAALKISPLFGNAGAGSLCSVWPVPGSDEAKHVDATGSAPIMVVGGKGDPATPYIWAPKLTAQLKTAVLITYEGEGHGAYMSGSRCIQAVVDAYLNQGKTPTQPVTCPA